MLVLHQKPPLYPHPRQVPVLELAVALELVLAELNLGLELVLTELNLALELV